VHGTAQGADAVIMPDETMLSGNLLDLLMQLTRVSPQDKHPETHSQQNKHEDEKGIVIQCHGM
jgi:hypothetical protein